MIRLLGSIVKFICTSPIHRRPAGQSASSVSTAPPLPGRSLRAAFCRRCP